MTILEVKIRLYHHFKMVNPGKYICPTSLLRGKGAIDVIKLDGWLHSKHGQYEAKGMSMKDLLIKEYGKETASFVENNL